MEQTLFERTDSLDFDEVTDEIKKNIGTAELSGKLAWKAGELLSKVKDQRTFKGKYSSFEKYCLKELRKSIAIINQYIEIFNAFALDDISNFTLIAHLKVLLEIRDDDKRRIVTNALMEFDPILTDEIKRPPYTADILGEVVDFANGSAALIVPQVADFLEKKIRAKRIQRDLVGPRLEPVYFRELSELFLNEPIDEQGTVALFCTLLPHLKGSSFEWEDRKVSFGAIEFVREKYFNTPQNPDHWLS